MTLTHGSGNPTSAVPVPDSSISFRRYLFPAAIGYVCFLVAVLAMPGEVHSSPFPAGVGWPEKSTIDVYVENIDPEGANSRQQTFANGIMRWQNELGRGYTINVHLGDPPAMPPENLVVFKWVQAGTKTKSGKTLTLNSAVTSITLDDPKKPKRIVSATGLLSRETTRGEALANLGMHEFTHALGLADDNKGVVTRTQVAKTGVMAFNDRDRAEIASLYGRKPKPAKSNANGAGIIDPLDSPVSPRARIDLTSNVAGQFSYRATFEGDETEAIDVVTFFIDPSLVTHVNKPTGWLYLDPAELAISGVDHPYFIDYMDDSETDPAPWESLSYLAFRSSDPQYDLSTLNPWLDFSIYTQNATPGLINVFAGNAHQQVFGPVPEPATVALLLIGVAVTGRRT